MKATKSKDLRSKTVEELKEMLADERAGLFKARTDLVFQRTPDRGNVNVRRHNIARILTIITEKERNAKA